MRKGRKGRKMSYKGVRRVNAARRERLRIQRSGAKG